MEQIVAHVSLYEYLGKRAGIEVGKQVYAAAKQQRVRVKPKQVNQGGYKGQVLCYPPAFLFGYFSHNPQPEVKYETY